MDIMSKLRQAVLALIVLVIGGASGVAGAYWYQSGHPFGGTTIRTLSSQPKIVEATSKSGLTIPSLVKQYSPAIVAITSKSTTYSFFGGPVTQEGEGTGMILTSSGYILTNNHVVPQGTDYYRQS